MTLEKWALTLLTALVGWVALTVQSLAVDMAVVKTRSDQQISPANFAAFRSEVTSELDRYNQWLSRLSERLNKLETSK